MAESMKDYENELEASFKKIEEGDILTGTVISVDEKEVTVDLKYYAEGIIPAEDYSREPGFSLKDEVHPGDEVSATVIRTDDGQGNILLSRVEAVDVLAWDKLKEMKASGEVLDVVVKGVVNGGAVAYVEGVRGFIPASKLALSYVEDTNEYLNKHIQVQVIDVDKEDKKLILSAKEILREKAEEERKNKISNIQPGFVTEGTVESLQPYGAFVDLGNGVSGLVHISQISNQRISSAADCLKIGQKVMAKIIDTNIPEKKINLSIRDVQAYDPEPKPVELDEDGNPILPERKERPRKKDRGDRPAKGEKRARKDSEEEVIADQASSMGTSIGDILASKLQPAIEVNAVLETDTTEESPAKDAESESKE